MRNMITEIRMKKYEFVRALIRFYVRIGFLISFVQFHFIVK